MPYIGYRGLVFVNADPNAAVRHRRNYMAQNTADRVSWYDNTDGEGTFDGGQDLTAALDGAQSLSAADFDGDGDVDVVAASHRDGLEWFKNANGLGAFELGEFLDPGPGAGDTFYGSADVEGAM